MKPAVMIDTETLGLNPDALVLQIGYCVADLDSGHYLVKPVTLNLHNHEQPTRDIDAGTVRWWLQQDKKVFDSVFFPTEYRSLADVKAELVGVVSSYGNNVTVWAKPAMFDLPLVKSLFACSLWSHRKERDMQTVIAMLDPDRKLVPPNNMAHNAGADAAWQMDYLLALAKVAKARGVPIG